jgi:hypothetical protein
MNNVFWIGVFPGLTRPMLDFVAGAITDFALESKSGVRMAHVSDGAPERGESALSVLP